MKNVSTGLGLAVLGVGIGLHAFSPQIAAQAQQPTTVIERAIATTVAAHAGPPAPTIVWYGSGSAEFNIHSIFRAWSDGTVEVRLVYFVFPQNGLCESATAPCHSPWFVIASPDEGVSAAADNNFDAKVDGADLAMLLASWGPAPRNPTPPSDCPLNLINP